MVKCRSSEILYLPFLDKYVNFRSEKEMPSENSQGKKILMRVTVKRSIIALVLVSFIGLGIFLVIKYFHSRKQSNSEVSEYKPIFSFSNNDCFITSVFNVLFRTESFLDALNTLYTPQSGRSHLFDDLLTLNNEIKKANKQPISLDIVRESFYKHLEWRGLKPGAQDDSSEFLVLLFSQLVVYDVECEYFQINLSDKNILSDDLLNVMRTEDNLYMSIFHFSTVIPQQGHNSLYQQLDHTIINHPRLFFVIDTNSYIPKNMLQMEFHRLNGDKYRLRGAICYNGSNHYNSIFINDSGECFHIDSDVKKIDDFKNTKNARILIYEKI
ncbi:hypothetical protein M153_4370001980 [Pseudoloma neurophilia]|uniref:Uncharacterized protein n=1 Tax=Pseudoloma neurophilia TaxID=146866 RepID=A0A0R0M519_9MICR|nr:hypothetical protein M153_4370001980 [Pseudoloma neurophilia]